MFFFFKQKTAYELRISDWSSDVCSSDLLDHLERADRLAEGLALAHVLQAGLVGGAGDADGLGCDADATGVEYAHGDLEAVAFLAQHPVGLHDVGGELDLAGGRGADAESSAEGRGGQQGGRTWRSRRAGEE